MKYSGLLRSYPELQQNAPLFPVSFAVALLGTCIVTSQELNPVRVLHRVWMSCDRLPLAIRAYRLFDKPDVQMLKGGFDDAGHPKINGHQGIW